MAFGSVYRFLFILLFVSLSSQARELQDLTSISANATHFLQQQLATPGSDQDLDIKISPIDPRLQLTACDKPLTFKKHSTSSNAGNMTLKASCRSPVSWSFYVSAQINRFGPVLVASRNLAKGERLTDADIIIEKRQLPTRVNSVIDQLEKAVGMEVKRHIPRGQVIERNRLTHPVVIQKGEHVIITAANSAISVVSSGVALGRGKVGDHIRVQNPKTNKVISGRVTAKGKVAVSL